MEDDGLLYDDKRIACDAEGVIIRWYYPWGPKKIPYSAIRAVRSFPLTRWSGGWRLWGSDDLVRWYNLDLTRPSKKTAIELSTGGNFRPTITPVDPAAVARILAEHTAP